MLAVRYQIFFSSVLFTCGHVTLLCVVTLGSLWRECTLLKFPAFHCRGRGRESPAESPAESSL